MVNREQIINKAIEAVEEVTDFKLRWDNAIRWTGDNSFDFPDGAIEIKIQDETILTFPVAIRQELRQYQLAQMMEVSGEDSNFLFIADILSSTMKELLREKKIGYIDTNGNIFINVPGHYVWIDGQKGINSWLRNFNRAFAKSGLKVIFYLLVNREAIKWTYRRLSEATGVSVGNITNVMNGLDSAGYLMKIGPQNFALQNKKDLLTRWIYGYNETLRPSLLIGKYWTRLDSWKDLPTRKGEDFWGEEAAAELITDFIKPQQLSLYTNQTKTEELKKLRLASDAERGNITLYQKFWNDPALDKEWHVPPLLVYTDLVLTDDPRCIEVAQMIYNQFLKDEFEEPERRRT